MAGGLGAGDRGISLIIVTHNSATVVGGLVASLPADVEIICVDNASADDIGAALAPFPAKLVRNQRNEGFGAACNRGAAVAAGEYLFFLNPDTLPAKDALNELRAAMVRYPDCTTFSPRIEDGSGRVENRDYNFIERAGAAKLVRLRAHFSGDCCVHFLHGGAFLIRKATFLELGGFDENLFLYYEDDDLAVRLLKRRQPIIYVHSACIRHGVQRSAKPTLRRRYLMNRHKKRSEIYIRRKYGIVYRRGTDIADLCIRVLLYALTLNILRLIGAIGRLAGAVSRDKARARTIESERLER